MLYPSKKIIANVEIEAKTRGTNITGSSQIFLNLKLIVDFNSAVAFFLDSIKVITIPTTLGPNNAKLPKKSTHSGNGRLK